MTDYGPLRNGCRLEVDWTVGSVTYLTRTVTLSAVLYFSSQVTVIDGSNSYSWSGSAFGSGSGGATSINGSGRRTVRSFSTSVNTVGSTQTKTLNATMRLVDYAGGDLTIAASQTVPARPAAPAPSNVGATRNSDTSHTITWTNNYSSTASDMYVVIQRQTGGDEWVSIASTVAPLATSYTDNTTVANQRYRYRVAVRHTSATSAYSTQASYTYTTPAAPTSVSASKISDTRIDVTATDQSAWNDRFEIRDSADGTTWTVLSTSVSSFPYVHNNPSTSVSHRYQIRAVTSSGLFSAWSSTSNIVAITAPPNAPASLTPNGGAVDVSQDIILGWVHNPTDSSVQTAYQWRYRTSTNGGTTWSAWVPSAKINSAQAQHSIAANFFASGVLVEWQVATWGAHATVSPWSASASFKVSSLPSVTITSPGAAAGTNRVTAAWTYFDPEGSAQSAWELALYRDGEPVYTMAGTGSLASAPVPYDLEDATSYALGVRVRDGDGLWSLEDVHGFNVAYVAPPAALVAYSWDPATGALTLEITNPAESGGQPAPVFNRVYSGADLIYDDLPLNTSVVDPIAPPGGGLYRVEVVSDLPSSITTEIVVSPDETVGRGFWLNAGPGWSFAASFYGNVERSQTVGVAKDVEHYAGRVGKVETFGEEETQEFSLSAEIVRTQVSEQAFFAIVRARTTVCYRDPYGVYFVSMGPITSANTQTATGKISFKMESLDYSRAVGYVGGEGGVGG